MIFHLFAEHGSKPTPLLLRIAALKSAIVLRDCSLRQSGSDAERRACRILMRGQALQWRHPEAA